MIFAQYPNEDFKNGDKLLSLLFLVSILSKYMFLINSERLYAIIKKSLIKF